LHVVERRLQGFRGGVHSRHRGVSSRFGRFPHELPYLTNDFERGTMLVGD
jgi:uncharacterized protein (DUF924 family)